MKRQALSAIVKAHSEGVFMMKKQDHLREFFHSALEDMFKKTLEKEPKQKNDSSIRLIHIIYCIMSDEQKCEKADHNEQELIDKSKLFYFDLIFKYFNTFEEGTKNSLLKIIFYKIIQLNKFKESSAKPIQGPLTKEELKSGLKHPASIEENPI